ncbi:hypothetical protein ACWF9G_22270 [Nocardia sp. NPDC055029]
MHGQIERLKLHRPHVVLDEGLDETHRDTQVRAGPSCGAQRSVGLAQVVLVVLTPQLVLGSVGCSDGHQFWRAFGPAPPLPRLPRDRHDIGRDGKSGLWVTDRTATEDRATFAVAIAPSMMVQDVHGKLLGAAPSSDGSIWVTTANKAEGAPGEFDDRVVQIPRPWMSCRREDSRWLSEN